MHLQSHSGRCAVLASALLCAGATTPAQNILVVDVNQGPGSQYADIQSAIDASQPGDRVHVRSGSYQGFAVDTAISVVAEPGTMLFGVGPGGYHVSVADTPAGGDTVVRGFQIFGAFGRTFSIRDCRGRVLLDGVVQFLGGGDSVIEDCDQVMLNRCVLVGVNEITRSTATLCEGSYTGSSLQNNPSAGLIITDSDVHLARPKVVGGPVFGSVNPAIQLADSTVTIAGPGRLALGTIFGGSGFVIEGGGTVLLDPAVALTGSLITGSGTAGIGSSVQVTSASLPTLAVNGGAVGGQTSVDLISQPGDSFLLFAGTPGDAVTIPAHGGSSWIDPQSSILVTAGTLDATGAFELSVTIPALVELAGEPVMWLAAAGSSTLQLSNNAGHTVGL